MRKPKTLMERVDGEVLRTAPMQSVTVAMVWSKFPNKAPVLVMAEVDFGDNEGVSHMEDFRRNCLHALKPGEVLYCNKITFTEDELLQKLAEDLH